MKELSLRNEVRRTAVNFYIIICTSIGFKSRSIEKEKDSKTLRGHAESVEPSV